MPGRRIALFLTLGLALLGAPSAAYTQPSGRGPVMGYLSALSRSDPLVQRNLDAILQRLRELGYVEGQNLAIEYRWAEGKVERLPELAAELVRLKVDVFVASGGLPVAQAAQKATKTIPIVFTGPADPVAAGLVASLARPGGNITGVAIITHELVGKELELLREMVPTMSRLAVLWNPSNPGNASQYRAAEAAAQMLGVRLLSLEVRGPGELEQAFAKMTKERADALLVLLDSMLLGQRTRVAELAAMHRLPAMYGLRLHAEAGGLMAYAADQDETALQIASYVARILKGAKPADLPVELPTRFVLVINMRTARDLGLTPSRSLLMRTTDLIE
jgi:putative tryptophan/tyrosine transport system substrate-binding protein